MKASQDALDLIKRWEGLRLIGYTCPAGVATIGYGTTGPDVKVGMVITEDQAENRLRSAVDHVAQGITDSLKTKVNQHQFDALVSFAYNVGSTAFRNSTLLKLLNDNTDKNIVAAEFARWNKVDGKPVEGLTRRRAAERELFLTKQLNPSMATSLLALQDTYLKREPKQAQELSAEQKLFVPKGSAHEWELIELVPGENHYRVHLKQKPEPAWWMYPPHWKIINDSAPPTVPTPPSVAQAPVLDVPYYSQRDNDRDPGRTCFSSSCAMLLKYLKPKSISSDDDYIDVVFKHGDTTEPSTQLKALREFGVEAVFRKNSNWDDLVRILKSGVPVPMGILHHGNIASPSGGGHWIVATGVWANWQGAIVNDPYGELDLVSGSYMNTNGDGKRYSKKNLLPRWCVEGGKSGWIIEAISW